jgi:hypothetical protein
VLLVLLLWVGVVGPSQPYSTAHVSGVPGGDGPGE